MNKLIKNAFSKSEHQVPATEGRKVRERAQQQFKDDTDINKIVARMTKTGSQPSWYARNAGTFSELPPATDLQTALALVEKGRVAFDDLPAEARQKFGNPVEFVKYMEGNPDPQDLIDLNLAKAPEVVPEAVDGPEPAPAPDPA